MRTLWRNRFISDQIWWNFNGWNVMRNVGKSLHGKFLAAAVMAVCSGYSAIAYADPTLPVIPNRTFNVTSYGALGNGSANNTLSIQNAINAAHTAGGGTVIIPSGDFLSGPLTLTSNINLEIDGELQMLPYGTFNAGSDFITASKVSNIEISGSGTIDGQGSPWWSAFNASNTTVRPKAMLAISSCTNVLVQNITLQNPPNTHIGIRNGCSNVTIRGITINTPSPSPNTDGIDLSASHVLIKNCNISDGDDNIAVGGSSSLSDITVQNCNFGVGHGMSIGSYTSGGINGMTVSNCTFNGTTSGIRIKSARDRGGLVQNLTYQHITMNSVRYPIYLTSYYPSLPSGGPASDPAQAITSTTPIYQNILINDLTSTNSASNGVVGIIYGLPEELISNVTLSNVSITARTGMDIYNANITLMNTTLKATSGANTILYNANVTVVAPEPATSGIAAAGAGVLLLKRKSRSRRTLS